MKRVDIIAKVINDNVWFARDDHGTQDELARQIDAAISNSDYENFNAGYDTGYKEGYSEGLDDERA